MNRKLLALLVLALMVTLTACQPVDYLKIIRQTGEFKELSSDFASEFGREPRYILKVEEKLTSEIIKQRFSQYINTSRGGDAEIYRDLPDSGSLYYVEYMDVNETDSGLVAVVDTNVGKAIKVFGLFNVKIG